MDRTQQDWQTLLKEVSILRKQNNRLSKLLLEKEEDGGQFSLIRSSVQPQMHSEESICIKCKKNWNSPQKQKIHLYEELKMWSQKINTNVFKKKPSIPEEKEDINIKKEDNQVDTISQNGKVQSIKLIEDICLFGPSRESLMNNDQKKFTCKHQLYYPQQDPKLQVYGNYLYPDQVPVKLIRQKNKSLEVDQMIFRKSLKQQDCSIFIFQGKEQSADGLNNNKLLTDINPCKWLFTIAIEFADYAFCDVPIHKMMLEKSHSMSLDSNESKIGAEFEPISPLPNLSEKKSYGQNAIYKSSFCLCIMTYFPFISFFTDILINLVDEVKIKRIESYSNLNRNISLVDIHYVAQEIQKLIGKMQPRPYLFQPLYSSTLKLSMGSKIGLLNLEQNRLNDELVSGWAFKTLKLLDKDSIYEIYCCIMLEESVCFICESQYKLTFIIYLFAWLLSKPFFYPHPCVSIMFNEELLETPFTTILGLNKDEKWVEEYQEYLNLKRENKVFVNLNEEDLKVRQKKKQKIPNSEKLKKIFKNFYKKIEKMESIQSKKNEMQSVHQVTKSENALIQQLMQDLQSFYDEEILSMLPNKEIIQNIKKSSKEENQSCLSISVIRDIEKYISQMRKNKDKDPFIQIFMQKQIFYVYLTTLYEII